MFEVPDPSDEEDVTPIRVRDLPALGGRARPLFQDVESAALRLLNSSRTPANQDIINLFRKLLRSSLRRGNDRSLYVVSGTNARSSDSVLAQCLDTPYLCMLVNRFIRTQSPAHPYSTWTLKQGCREGPHRDTRNGPTESWILSLTHCESGEGLWIADRIGRVYKRHKGEDLAGSVLPLNKPVIFNARKHLHAGHVNDPLRAQTRIVLIAFSTLNAATVCPKVSEQLSNLGFPIPTPEAFQEAIHGVGRGDEPRLKQLTLQEALQLGQDTKDRHDVIEVKDTPLD